MEAVMKRLLVSVVLIASSGCPTFGAEDGCSTAKERENRFSELISAVDGLRRKIERVPPSDAEFIRREKRDALKQRNRVRFNILASNQYYYPLQVHDEVDKVLNHLRGARGEGVKGELQDLIFALRDFGDI